MNSAESYRDRITWTAAEKRLARQIFDRAFQKQCASIAAEAKKMIASFGPIRHLASPRLFVATSKNRR